MLSWFHETIWNPKATSRGAALWELLGQGLNLPAVADKIDCSVSSVHRWQRDHRKKGSEGLMSKPVPGRPGENELAPETFANKDSSGRAFGRGILPLISGQAEESPR